MLKITKEYIDHFKALLEEEDKESILLLIRDLHYADIASVVEELYQDEARQFFSYLEGETASDVLAELDEDVQQDILEDLSATEIVEKYLDPMDSDDAADIINELPSDIRIEVVSLLEQSTEEDAKDVIELLDYKEDTAGGLMAKELIRVNMHHTVSQCIKEIREQREEVEDVYAVYVVDEDSTLKGIIPLKNLVLFDAETMVSDLLDDDIKYARVDTAAEEVAMIMQKYDLVYLPVVNTENKLVGRITIDDVIDFIKEEAEQDYQLASGISEDVDHSDKIWVISRSRLPWLILGLFGGILASLVISRHEDAIRIYPEMAFFIPIITAMAGNVGIQSSALVVQSLASNTLGERTFSHKLFKELSVALINGLLCSSILLTYGFFFADMPTAITIGISLLTVILLASTLGLIIPLFLNRINIDPALATGPFITTSNDIIGLGVYFLIGHYMYAAFV